MRRGLSEANSAVAARKRSLPGRAASGPRRRRCLFPINTPPHSQIHLMARGIHTRKRSRTASGSKRRTFKKRRTVRRGRKTNAFTSQSGTGGGLRFKGKRTSRSAYKKHLWDSTLYKDHYRSLRAVSSSINTNTNTNDLVILAEAAYLVGITPFYLAGGGAVTNDVAVLLPSFNGDIIVRGGMVGLRLANTLDTVAANTGSIQGTVFLIKTTKNWQGGVIPASGMTGWDPTMIPDFDTKVGKILYRKNFLLRDADTAVVEYRLPIHKVDQGDVVALYNTYVWLVMAGNVDSALTKNVTVTKYWNMSFAGDAF